MKRDVTFKNTPLNLFFKGTFTFSLHFLIKILIPGGSGHPGVIFWRKKAAGGSLGTETWLLKEKGVIFGEKKTSEAAWGRDPGF